MLILPLFVVIESLELLDGHLFIDLGLVFDSLSSSSEPQRRQRFIKVVFGRTARDDQTGLRVATKRLLQNSSQL